MSDEKEVVSEVLSVPEPKLTLSSLTDVTEVFTVFQTSMNAFVKGIRDFQGSKRQLEDVVINLTVAPLNKDDFEWSYPEQKALFEIGNDVNSTKFFLMLAGMAKEKKIAFLDETPQVEVTSES